MNPMQMLQAMFKSNGNPQQMAMQLMKGNSNPMLSNLMEMGQNGDTKGVENFARNVCKEKGIDFDTEFPKFLENFK